MELVLITLKLFLIFDPLTTSFLELSLAFAIVFGFGNTPLSQLLCLILLTAFPHSISCMSVVSPFPKYSYSPWYCSLVGFISSSGSKYQSILVATLCACPPVSPCSMFTVSWTFRLDFLEIPQKPNVHVCEDSAVLFSPVLPGNRRSLSFWTSSTRFHPPLLTLCRPTHATPKSYAFFWFKCLSTCFLPILTTHCLGSHSYHSSLGLFPKLPLQFFQVLFCFSSLPTTLPPGCSFYNIKCKYPIPTCIV